MPKSCPSASSLISLLKASNFDEFLSQFETALESPTTLHSYSTLYSVCALATGALNQQKTHFQQRKQQSDCLVRAIIACCRRLSELPTLEHAASVKIVKLFYSVMFACSESEQIQALCDVSQLLLLVLPLSEAGSAIARDISSVITNSSRLLLAAGRKLLVLPTFTEHTEKITQLLAASLRLCCHLVSTSSPAESDKLFNTGLVLAEGLLSKPGAEWNRLSGELVQLARAFSTTSAGVRLILAAVRVAAVSGCSVSCLQQLDSPAALSLVESSACLKLLRGVVAAMVGDGVSPDGVDSCSEQLSSLSLSLSDSDSVLLSAETLHTIYTVLRFSSSKTDCLPQQNGAQSQVSIPLYTLLSSSANRLLSPLLSTDHKSIPPLLTILRSLASGTSHLAPLLPLRLLNLLNSMGLAGVDMKSVSAGAICGLLSELSLLADRLLNYSWHLSTGSDKAWAAVVLLNVAGNVCSLYSAVGKPSSHSFQLYLRTHQTAVDWKAKVSTTKLVNDCKNLAIALRKQGEFDSALQIVADTVWTTRDQCNSVYKVSSAHKSNSARQCSSAHRADSAHRCSSAHDSVYCRQLMTVWATVKRTARRSNKQHSCLTVTICDLIQRQDRPLCQSLRISLLKEELVQCQGSGSLDMSPVISVCLDQLCSSSIQSGLSELDQIWLLVTRVKYSHVTVNAELLQQCRRFLQWLEKQDDAGGTDTTVNNDGGGSGDYDGGDGVGDSVVNLIAVDSSCVCTRPSAITVARCVLSCQCFLIVKQLEQAQAEAHPLAMASSSDAAVGSTSACSISQLQQQPAQQPDEEIDLNASCTVTATSVHGATLTSEVRSLRLLIDCVSLGSRLLSSGMLSGGGFCSADVLLSVQTSAELLTGLGYSLLAANAWGIVYQLAVKLQKTTAQIDAICHLSERNFWSQLFEDDLLISGDSSNNKCELTEIRQKLARAWRYFHRSQFVESWQLLHNSILSSNSLTVRWTEHAATAASAHQLTAVIITSCSSHQLQKLQPAPSSQLQHLSLACFFSRCLSHWSWSDDQSCLSKRIYYSGLVVDYISSECHVHVSARNPRDIRAQCRSHLSRVHRCASVLRLVSLLSLLIEADLMSEDTTDASLKLTLLERFLLTESPDTDFISSININDKAISGSNTDTDCNHSPLGQKPLPPLSPQRQSNSHRSAVDWLSVGSPPGRETRWAQSARWSRAASPCPGRRSGGDVPDLLPSVSGHCALCRCVVCVEPVRVQLMAAFQRQKVCLNRQLWQLGDNKATGCRGGAAGAELCHRLAITVLPSMEQAAKQLLLANQQVWYLEMVVVERFKCLLAVCDLQCCDQRLVDAQNSLRLYQQTLSSCSDQFLNRNSDLVDQLYSRQLLISAALSWSATDDEFEDNTLTTQPELLDNSTLAPPSDTTVASRPLTPPLLTPVVTASLAPCRAPRRAARAKQQQLERSPPLVRRTRRTAANVRRQIAALSVAK